MNKNHLIASPNMLLTNGKIYASEVWLGDWDSPENWWEILKEIAEEIQREKELQNEVF